jgi:polyisoprenoid-binding protein YceI
LQPTTGNAAELRGRFTVKGITEPVPLPVRVFELDDGSVRISVETKVDRAQFGLGWNKLGVMSSAATIAADTVFVRAPA